MKITLLFSGKTSDARFASLIDDYQQRLKHYVPFEIVVLPDLKNAKALTEDQIKTAEGNLILQALTPAMDVILLDEHGTEHTSTGFAQYLQKQMNAGIRSLTFVIGGAFGFAPSVYAAASDKVSLSKMTFNHQMVRLFFAEQLYRAFTILNHEPYHNE